MSSGPLRPGPLWREEFSIDRAEEQLRGRRQFAKFLVLTSLGMFAGNVWILCKRLRSPASAAYPLLIVAAVRRAAGRRRQALPLSGAATIACILVRTAEDEYAAYSQKCTHLSCAVYYRSRAAIAWNALATKGLSRCATAG